MDHSTTQGAPPLHILIVEDDDATAGMLVHLLETEHYRVSWAARADAALAVLGAADDARTQRSDLPDLVVLDLQLAVLSGPDLLRLLTRRSATMPPVIVLSTGRDAAMQDAAAAIGARYALLKPFAVEDLLAQIATVAHELVQARGSRPTTS